MSESVITPIPSSPQKIGTPTHVSEQAYELLLTSILHFIEKECQREHQDVLSNEDTSNEERTKRIILIAEHAAAKMERMGYDVGFRIVERLLQNKSLAPNIAPGKSVTTAAIQLEVMKFICKEFWMEIFSKQIDKLQTNHKGVFVLKDSDFKWLKRLPGNVEIARVTAIKILAFPCGLIRGALANLNVSAVVSCDFLADGKNMQSCSFNIKIKS
jgi:trafficking protein particle complex subunit 6